MKPAVGGCTEEGYSKGVHAKSGGEDGKTTPTVGTMPVVGSDCLATSQEGVGKQDEEGHLRKRRKPAAHQTGAWRHTLNDADAQRWWDECMPEACSRPVLIAKPKYFATSAAYTRYVEAANAAKRAAKNMPVHNGIGSLNGKKGRYVHVRHGGSAGDRRGDHDASAHTRTRPCVRGKRRDRELVRAFPLRN